MDSRSVLVLVKNADHRERVVRRLVELEVEPVVVRCSSAMAAIRELRPLAVVLDEPHAATAPEDFLQSTREHRVHLVTVGDEPAVPSTDEWVLRHALGRTLTPTVGT